jgi:hypothetical protein
VLRVLGALGLATAAGIAGWTLKPGPPAAPLFRFELPRALAEASSVAFAPDGTRLAYIKDGRLYLHALTSGIPSDLGAVPPTAGNLFWSPDSQTIGFAAQSTIRTVPAAGGTPLVVCRIPASGRVLAAIWLPDKSIVFSVWRENVYRVSAAGGTPALHVALDPATEVDVHSLTMTPDNRLLLTVHLRGMVDDQRVDMVENGRRTPLLRDNDVWDPQFVLPNQLLFVRQRTNPGVWVAPFDGRSIDLADASMVIPGATGFAAGGDRTLVAMFTPTGRRDLVWVTRSGTTTALPGQALELSGEAFGLAPEGRRALLSVRAPDLRREIIVRDLTTGADTRVPPPRPASPMSAGASVSWAPDGHLLYAIGGVETSEIFDWPADGSTGGRKLVEGTSARRVAGRPEIYFTRDERGAWRLRRAALQADGTVSAPEAILGASTEPMVRWFDVSSDGRLLAFTDADGDTRLTNIFVATLPDLRERRQVTSTGGVQPKFSRDNTQLFYFSGTRTDAGTTHAQLSAVSITMNPLTISAPSVVLVEDPARGLTFTAFDVAADGRLLMTRRAGASPGDEARVVFVQNWVAAIIK